MAAYELLHSGRQGAIKAILLMTDGQPNSSTGTRTDYCREAIEVAAAAKAQGIEIYTVGFGVDDVSCEDPVSTPWYHGETTTMLAAMATDSTNDGCTDAENDDGDHYFCLPRSGDLSDIFRRAIVQLTAHSRLVKLPDTEL